MITAIDDALSSTTQVAEVSSVGTLELSANIIEFNSHGKAYKQKLVGQKDSGTLSLTLNWVAGDTSHAALKTKFDAGTAQVFAVKWISGSENAVAQFTGYISTFSIDTPVEDVVSANVEIAIDGGVAFALVTA
tara:strand:+ start:5404 stop:5802 length:399 start_codon:yes stop_codon:yes gene_type:complete